MARPWFKRMWTRIVPKQAERSTYVLLSSVLLILSVCAVAADWRSRLELSAACAARGALRIICDEGFLLVLISTFLINHFDLFGLRQVWLYLRGKDYTQLGFGTPILYRHVRHPLYLGWRLRSGPRRR